MWYKALGFSSYPLGVRSNTQLVGVENIKKRIKDYIIQGNMCLICGYTGSGKTSMLETVARDPEVSQFKFVYISADGVKRDYDVEDAIRQSANFVERLLRKKPKNLVIMLDESHMANRLLTESIKSKWNVQYEDGTRAIQSVIVSQIENRLGTNFSGSFADRLGKRVVMMPKLSADDLLGVLSVRLQAKDKNWTESFEEEALQFLAETCDGSVRQLLEYADCIFTHHEAVESGNPLLNPDYKVSKEAVFNILQTRGLVSYDRLNKNKEFQKLLSDDKKVKIIEMFIQFGALSEVDLAEKMDITFEKAQKQVAGLIKKHALEEAHVDDGRQYYVLNPRLQHEMTRA